MFTFSFSTDTPLSDMFVLKKAHVALGAMRDAYLEKKSTHSFNLDNDDREGELLVLTTLIARYDGLLSLDQVKLICVSQINRIYFKIDTKCYTIAHTIVTWMTWSVVNTSRSSRVVNLFDNENRKTTVSAHGWYFHDTVPQRFTEL